MIVIYALAVYSFHYGLVFDHIELFRTNKACVQRANNLPRGYFPDTASKVGSVVEEVNCERIKVSK